MCGGSAKRGGACRDMLSVFFQAEDGIRDYKVTGVQTCALPICIVKSYPAAQALISGEQSKQDSSLVVSWESLERRKAEYDELVHKKIPANSREIAEIGRASCRERV